MSKPLKIAILGTRGIPACYGGFETFAERLSQILVERGHALTVFGRRKFFRPDPACRSHNGVTLRYAPTIMHKYLETPVAALTSFLELVRYRFDVVLLCNAANSPFAWIVKALGIPLVINVDGIERHRAKWNQLGRLWYKLGEYCSVKFADTVVADAQVIADYYRATHASDTTVIAYGASATVRAPGAALQRFKLEPSQYLLYVSRLEPENNALGVIEAYRSSGVALPLVIVGDAPYADSYKEKLRQCADEKVIFTGFQFGEVYQELQSNCLAYIQATEVGGTHPALIEAMAYGNCVIANGTPENREVLSGTGLTYSKNDFAELATLMKFVQDNPTKRSEYGNLAKARAESVYNWEKIANQYEECFGRLVRAGGREAIPDGSSQTDSF